MSTETLDRAYVGPTHSKRSLDLLLPLYEPEREQIWIRACELRSGFTVSTHLKFLEEQRGQKTDWRRRWSVFTSLRWMFTCMTFFFRLLSCCLRKQTVTIEAWTSWTVLQGRHWHRNVHNLNPRANTRRCVSEPLRLVALLLELRDKDVYTSYVCEARRVLLRFLPPVCYLLQNTACAW